MGTCRWVNAYVGGRSMGRGSMHGLVSQCICRGVNAYVGQCMGTCRWVIAYVGGRCMGGSMHMWG